MKDKWQNPIYKKTAQILTEKNYDIVRVVKDKAPNAPEEQFEFWAGRKGVVILQLWRGTNGVATYANWPLGTTFEDLEKAI